MAKNIEVHTDARSLNDYRNELSAVHKRLVDDAAQLSNAFSKAEWNDAVTEKARQALNSYIRELNRALGYLGGVIRGTAGLQELAEHYESMG